MALLDLQKSAFGVLGSLRERERERAEKLKRESDQTNSTNYITKKAKPKMTINTQSEVSEGETIITK